MAHYKISVEGNDVTDYIYIDREIVENVIMWDSPHIITVAITKEAILGVVNSTSYPTFLFDVTIRDYLDTKIKSRIYNLFTISMIETCHPPVLAYSINIDPILKRVNQTLLDAYEKGKIHFEEEDYETLKARSH